MSAAVDRVLAALREHGHEPRRAGSGWCCTCPAHPDKDPSLSVHAGDDGRALVHCFAGCPAAAICEALGLTEADLFEGERANGCGPPREKAPEARRREGADESGEVYATANDAVRAIEARYGPRSRYWTYHSAAGEPVGLVVRWDRAGGGKRVLPVSRVANGWKCRAMPAPRPLYGLPDLLATPAGSRVYVVEGEKCAEAARTLDLLATASAGGAKAANKTDWSPLRGREVVVLPDNDSAGEGYAADVVRPAHAAGAASVRVVRVADGWPDLPPGGDLADVVERAGGDAHALAEVRAEVEALAEAAAPEARPLPAWPAWVPFPVEVLPEPVRGFVGEVAGATGTDPACAVLAALVVLAGAVGNRAAVVLKQGWSEPAVLWGAIVGRSGTTKSPVLRLVVEPLIALHRGEAEAFAAERAAYEARRAEYEVAREAWKKARKKGEHADPPLEPEPPAEKRLVISDATTEKVGALLADNPLGLLLVRDELSAWVGAFDRYAPGGKGADAPTWLSFYGAAPTLIDRKGHAGGGLFVERAAVSVLGTIQPRTLERVFGVRERESGLLARVLLVEPPERPARWTDDELSERAARRWADLLGRILAIEPARDETGGVRPRLIGLADEAKRLFVAWHDRHGEALAEAGDDDLAAYLAKLKGVCARLALVLALADAAWRGEPLRAIGAGAMRAAIALADWFAHEGERVYGRFTETEADAEARALVAWVERRGGEATVRDLAKSGPRGAPRP